MGISEDSSETPYSAALDGGSTAADWASAREETKTKCLWHFHQQYNSRGQMGVLGEKKRI